MKISALQKARAEYQPKLPQALKETVKVTEGAATQSVADQEAIKSMFPNTYGLPIVTFEKGGDIFSFCISKFLKIIFFEQIVKYLLYFRHICDKILL